MNVALCRPRGQEPGRVPEALWLGHFATDPLSRHTVAAASHRTNPPHEG